MAIPQHLIPFLGPLLKPLLGLRWFARAAETASRFVASNRPVILPARETAHASVAPFSAPYRLLYLALSWLITASFLHRYSQLLVPLIPASSYGREFLICGGQIFWQLGFLAILPGGKGSGKIWDYLGNMMTISLAGGLGLGLLQLLSPLVSISSLSPSLSPYLFGALFTGVAGLMFLEHIRRTRLLGLSGWLTVTWVLYRVVLLGVILWL